MDCLPDIHYYPENRQISVVGFVFWLEISPSPLDSLSLAFWFSGHQWGDGQIQGWWKGWDGTRLKTASCLLKLTTSTNNIKKIYWLTETKDGWRTGACIHTHIIQFFVSKESFLHLTLFYFEVWLLFFLVVPLKREVQGLSLCNQIKSSPLWHQ